MNSRRFDGWPRRDFLRRLASGAALAALRPGLGRATDDAPDAPCALAFSTYGMKGMVLEKAIRRVAEIGYDGLEIAVMPGYDGEPASLSQGRRRELASLLKQQELRLSALMEHLPPQSDDTLHRRDLARLRLVFELARELAPDKPPLVQTVLGGGTWDTLRNLFRDRVGDWLTAAREAGIVLCVKPHRGGALSRPSEGAWLLEQLGNSPSLRIAFDYSHYAFRDMPLEEAIREAASLTGYVVFKDAVQREGKVMFQLPGASGLYDYAKQLRLFRELGYRGDFCCEVSGQVSSAAGYDPIAAARACYAELASACEKAAVPRLRPAA